MSAAPTSACVVEGWGMVVLTDAQWTELEPLVEVCRPHAKVPPSDLRRTVEAIIWRCTNGAKWRAVPAELGPWWNAAQVLNLLGEARRVGSPAHHGAGARRPPRHGVS